MRSTNRKRSLLVSGAIIMLCMTVIVGMTWAVFTDIAKVETHLQAGDLNITLERTGLVTCSVDTETGYLVTTEATTDVVNFSNPTDANVFGLTNDSRIVPGSYYEATMQISNNTSANDGNAQNSDVAYDYWIEIKLNYGDLTEDEIAALKIDEQLLVTVKPNTQGSKSAYLSEGLTFGSGTAPIGTLARGGSDSFTVKIEFVGSENNDLAKAQAVTFDLVVHAAQRTTAP